MKTVRRMAAFLLLAALLCGVCAAASVKIDRATVSGKSVDVRTTVDLPEGARVVLAFYDENGKMIAARFADAVSEKLPIAPATVKAFIADGGFVPLGAFASAVLQESYAIEVASEAELIAANENGDYTEIVVTASFALTQNIVIAKDLRILNGVTLDASNVTAQCDGKVTLVGSGKITGLFAVEFGIEVIDEIDDNWG